MLNYGWRQHSVEERCSVRFDVQLWGLMSKAGQRHRQHRPGQQKRVLALVLRRTVVDECDVQEITLFTGDSDSYVSKPQQTLYSLLYRLAKS